MLVVLREGSGAEWIDAIKAIAVEAGLQTTFFGGDTTRPIILLTGDNVGDVAPRIEQLSAVERIASAQSNGRPETYNLRIAGIRPLVPPLILMEQLPLPDAGAVLVHRTRTELRRILAGDDDRLIVVVGPCSIHDPAVALDYAAKLADVAKEHANELSIVMRVYFEKPRTTVGWKGLINDPHLDGSFAVNEGLYIARRFLLDVIELGLPAGCEFLDPVSPQFLADAVSWGAIGARTTESQVHRNLTSGLSMPIGFKNGTSGDIQIAVDACNAASYPHQFMSVTEQGVAAIVETRGNRDTHLILRGGSSGTNYDAESVAKSLAALKKAGMPERVMIDASHGNSNKDYRRQPDVIRSVAEQVAAGQRGIIGVMLESFLVDGRQDLANRAALVSGQSITDSCMGWEMTVPVLKTLAEAVAARRNAAG
jgi:3-deoxy-7-phosphoheptulonate synthase